MQEEGIAVIEPLADLDHLTPELRETLLCFVLVGPGSQHAFCSRWDGWLAQDLNTDADLCFHILCSAVAAKHVVRAATCSMGSASAELLPWPAASVSTCECSRISSLCWMQVRLWAVAAPARHPVSAPEHLQSGFVPPPSLLLHHGWLPACTGAVLCPVHQGF